MKSQGKMEKIQDRATARGESETERKAQITYSSLHQNLGPV